MTHRTYWDDPYLTALATTVSGTRGNEVTLTESIFYASAGGQESDQGTIAGREVLNARSDGPEIRYELGANHGLAVGDAVMVEIDGARRGRLRRLHMATEIVLELLTQEDPTLIKLGAHIGADKARIDFECDSPLTDRLPAITAAATTMVEADTLIDCGFEGESGRRQWEIAGFARVQCGGTLPARTGEIGPVSLRRRNPGKGKERVEITLD